MRFPIIIYPSEDDEGGRFTAHCLNMDLIADDDTIEGAVSGLLETIEASLEASQKHNANVFRDAPDEYWEMLKNAKELPSELKERIIFNANKRISKEGSINAETELDLRSLLPA